MPTTRLSRVTRLRLLIYAVVAIAIIAAIGFFAVREVREQSGLEVLEGELNEIPVSPVTQDEVNGVFYSYEGQKLSRDFQDAMSGMWQAKVFEAGCPLRVAQATQQHLLTCPL